jgi:hypothetical protein
MDAKRTKPKKPKKRRVALLLGVGLDGDDGHRRVTRGRDFVLVGGSRDTHEELQERAIKVNEELDRRGKRLADVSSRDEMRDIVERAWRRA